MRNLKRALSLTLASVMLLGMMVVGSSAASYPDVDENDNIEAIEVLQAVRVMRGDDNGNFDPDRNVTRAEMAVVMALLLDYDYQYYETSCPFTDVPSWARPYVDACYANKIVAGYDAATYGANDGVTAVQASAMMMRALGYFQTDADYADGFETATVRQGTRIGIDTGVGSSATAAMTRNQVAQMALNALECTMVDARKNTADITVGSGDTAVTINGQVEYIVRTSNDRTVAAAISTAETDGTGTNGVRGYTVELGEQLYNGDLRKNTGVTDGFKAPATRWSYKNTEIGTYTDTANYALEGTVKSGDMYATVGKAAAEDYSWTVYMDGQRTNLNGEDDLFGQAEVKANNGDDLAGTGRGTTIYVYLDNTAHGGYAGTATVCVVNTYAAEVTKVANGKITLDDMGGKRLDFETTGYSEDDVVLYTKYRDGSSWTVASVIGEAELVEGEAKTVRADKYVVIGDTTYNYSAQFNDDNGGKLSADSADAEVAIYLDRQGNIIYVGDAKENTNYAFVLGVGKASSKYTDEADFGAQLVCGDGTILNVDLDSDYTDEIIADAKKEDSTARAAADSDKDDDADLKAVFVTTADITGSNDIIFVVGADNVKLNGTGSNRYYVYDAVVKGEATTIEVRYGSTAAKAVESLKKGDIGIFFGMTASDGYVTRLNTTVPSGVRINGKDNEWTPYSGTQRLTEGVYGFGSNGDNSYEFHIAPSDNAAIAYLDGSDLTIEGRVETDINDKAWVVTDDGELAAIFVMKVADDANEDEELPEFSISEVNGVIVITSIESLNNNQIVQAIAEHLGVDVDEVAYNSRTKEATVGRTTYGVSFTRVGTKEEVAGAELAAVIENAVKTPFGTVEVKGNEIIVTGGSDYGDEGTTGEGHSSKAVNDLARFLEALHNEGVESITYDEKEYVWDEDQTYRSKWVPKNGEEEGARSSEPATLMEAIVTAIQEDFTKGSCSFTIEADGKPIKFTIETEWRGNDEESGESQ